MGNCCGGTYNFNLKNPKLLVIPLFPGFVLRICKFTEYFFKFLQQTEKFDNVSILADFAEGLQALGTQLAKAELSFCNQMDNVGKIISFYLMGQRKTMEADSFSRK